MRIGTYISIITFNVNGLNAPIKKHRLGFPGGAVVESPPANAGDTGSCPGPGRSHMPRSGWAREPWPLSLRVRSLCSATGEATTVRGPCTEKKKKLLNYLLTYFWLCWVLVAVCGLYSSCGEWGLIFAAVRVLLIVVASLAVEHGL